MSAFEQAADLADSTDAFEQEHLYDNNTPVSDLSDDIPITRAAGNFHCLIELFS
jgi:hypothetical protein